MITSGSNVAIIDYGLGNLFSVKHACEHAGLPAIVTGNRREIADAGAAILPGVGAFGDAMETLRRLDLAGVIRDVAASGRPLMGICLGVQLLMEESEEFGRHKGLGVFKGRVVKILDPREGERRFKVPQVGWNTIHAVPPCPTSDRRGWAGTYLEGVDDGEFMYFVHSFIIQPAETDIPLSETTYGGVRFVSSVQRGNVFACQFHPERSGAEGLKVYQALARRMSAAQPSGEKHV